jgi:hypothetical protein
MAIDDHANKHPEEMWYAYQHNAVVNEPSPVKPDADSPLQAIEEMETMRIPTPTFPRLSPTPEQSEEDVSVMPTSLIGAIDPSTISRPQSSTPEPVTYPSAVYNAELDMGPFVSPWGSNHPRTDQLTEAGVDIWPTEILPIPGEIKEDEISDDIDEISRMPTRRLEH